MKTLNISDRYGALGIRRPDPKTMCLGDCEGTGIVPVEKNDRLKIYRDRWKAAEKKHKTDHGYHFVKCRHCNGTRKRKGK